MASVLIVEDERIVAEELKRTLGRMGHEVGGIASTFERAMALASERPPDVVLMDIHIKGKQDGILAAQAMRHQFQIPVIYLTAFADPVTIQRARETEPYGYLVKPFSDTQLKAAIEMAVYKHEMENRLSEHERWFRALHEATPDALVITDETGAITLVNAQTERLFGYTRHELVGRPIELLMAEDCRAQHDVHLRDIIQAGGTKPRGGDLDLYGLHRAGRKFPVEVSLSPFQTGSGTLVISAIRDVTEHRAAEKEAREANRLKDEFLATLSHELRTPLNAILGWSTMLAAGTLDADALPRAVESLARSARHLSQLVDDVLDVSRSVSGTLRMNVESVRLTSVIDAAVDTIRPAADAKAIALSILPDRSEVVVAGDPGRLQQIVWNLVSNAVKFTPNGGRVQVTLERSGSHAEIIVSDTGSGIAAEFVPFAFDRFRQANSTLTRRSGGLGLGLAIVRDLVELHGGSVVAESDGENCGATFRVRLPIRAALPDQRQEAPAALRSSMVSDDQVAADIPDLRGITLLLVDDDSETQELLKTMIRRCGAGTTAAASAAEALEVLADTRPDLIICDVGMPDRDGYSLIREIRSRSAADGGRIPAVALTACARAEDRRRALLAGFQSHIAKPAEPVELMALIATLVGRTASPGVVSRD